MVIIHLVLLASLTFSCKKRTADDIATKDASGLSEEAEENLTDKGSLTNAPIHRVFAWEDQAQLGLRNPFRDALVGEVEGLRARGLPVPTVFRQKLRVDPVPGRTPGVPTEIGTFTRNQAPVAEPIGLAPPRQERISTLDDIKFEPHEAGGLLVMSRGHPDMPPKIAQTLRGGPTKFEHGGLVFTKVSEGSDVVTFRIENPEFTLRKTLVSSSPEELARSGWQISEQTKLGVGSFGTVYKQTFVHKDGRTISMAVKEIQLPKGKKGKGAAEAVRVEVENNSFFGNHPQFVGYFGRQDVKGKAVLYSELLTPLKVSEFRPRSVDEMAAWTAQAADGFTYMHGSHFLHRDIKPENFLMDSKGQVRIADLGLAKRADDIEKGIEAESGSTPFYMPPEDLRALQTGDPIMYRPTSDIYSLGLSLLEWRRGRGFRDKGDAFAGENPQGLVYKIAAGKLPLPSSVAKQDILSTRKPDDLDDLYMRMVDENPARRPRMREVYEATQAIREGRYSEYKAQKEWKDLQWESPPPP